MLFAIIQNVTLEHLEMGVHIFAIVKMEVHVTMWMATVMGSANLDGLCPAVHKVITIYLSPVVSILFDVIYISWNM